jgi:hypothetical protein
MHRISGQTEPPIMISCLLFRRKPGPERWRTKEPGMLSLVTETWPSYEDT